MNTIFFEHNDLRKTDNAVRKLVIEEITNSRHLDIAVLIRLTKVSALAPDKFCRVVLLFNQDFHCYTSNGGFVIDSSAALDASGSSSGITPILYMNP